MVRLALAAVVFVVLAAAAAAILRRPGRDRGDEPMPPPGAGAFDTLVVTRGTVATTLRRQGDSFWVTAPVVSAADPRAAAAAFEAIQTLEPGALLTQRPVRYPELAVDDTSGIVVRATQDRRPRIDLVIGRTIDEGAGASAGTAVRVRGGRHPEPVWQVNGDLRAIFDRSPSGWRDHGVTTFAAPLARELAIQASDGARIRLRRTDAGAGPPGWLVVDSTQPIDALDDQVPREIIATMAALKATRFADSTTLAAAGLEPPALTITVTLGGGAASVLLIGKASGPDEVFVKTADSSQIFLARRSDIERVDRRPIQFRDKLLCDLREAELEEIAVKHGIDSYTLTRESRTGLANPGGPANQTGQGLGVWRATAPRGLHVDAGKAAALASIFRGWRAPRIAEDPPRGALDAPAVVITGRSRSGRCTIAAAPDPSAEAYLARVPPAPEIFVLPRWMIDRIAVKIAQLRAR